MYSFEKYLIDDASWDAATPIKRLAKFIFARDSGIILLHNRSFQFSVFFFILQTSSVVGKVLFYSLEYFISYCLDVLSFCHIIFHLCMFWQFCLYLNSRVTERQRSNSFIFDSPLSCRNSQRWAKRKSKAQNSIHASHMSGRDTSIRTILCYLGTLAWSQVGSIAAGTPWTQYRKDVDSLNVGLIFATVFALANCF